MDDITELRLTSEEWAALERCLAKTGFCRAAWVDGTDLAENRVPDWADPRYDIRHACCVGMWLHEAGLYRMKGRESEPVPQWEGEKKVGLVLLQHVRSTLLLVAYAGWPRRRVTNDMDDFRQHVDLIFGTAPLAGTTLRRRWWLPGHWGKGGLSFVTQETWWVFLVEYGGRQLVRMGTPTEFGPPKQPADNPRSVAVARWPSWTGKWDDGCCYHEVLHDDLKVLEILRRTVDVKVFRVLPP